MAIVKRRRRMKTEQEQIKELREIRCELIMALGGLFSRPDERNLDYAGKVYEKAKDMEASEVEKLVPVITKKWLVIDLDRDPRIMSGEYVRVAIENHSILPDQKAYNLAYDTVWECFYDICSCGTDGHTRYMSSAGVRITFTLWGTTIGTIVRDIKPNE